MKKDKVYRAWCNIKQRCHNRQCPAFLNYGGRGIEMHREWRHSFEAFASAIGAPPSPSHSIERIDNDRGYEPGNVTWATRAEQSRNRRNTLPWFSIALIRFLARRGEQKKAIALAFGVDITTVERNTRDISARARWCKRGHAFTADNRSGGRRCRVCANARALGYYHANARAGLEAKGGSK